MWINKQSYYGIIDTSLLLDLDASTLENTNSQWFDVSTFNRNVFATTGEFPTLTPDAFGMGNSGYSFDGIDKFRIVDVDDLSFCTSIEDLPYTILVQVRIDTSFTSQQYFISKLSPVYEYEILYANGTIYWNMNSESGYIATRKAYTFSNLGIYEIIFTYDGVNKQNGTNIYINKILQTGLTRIINNYTHMINTTSNVLIGGGTSSLQGFFGKCKIWNKCLTQTEINSL